ncbi:MAG: hypothetical protein VB857_01130, partial [Pirellulaceae bacterium]
MSPDVGCGSSESTATYQSFSENEDAQTMPSEHENDHSQLTPETGPGDTGQGAEPADYLEPVTTAKPRLPRAGTALLVFLAFFATQLLGFLVVGIIAGVYAGLSGVDVKDAEAIRKTIEPFILYSILPVFIISGLPVLGLTRFLAADAIRDGSSTGVGWLKSTPLVLFGGLLLGAFFAFGCLFLYGTLFSDMKPDAGSPISQMASTGTLARVLLGV